MKIKLSLIICVFLLLVSCSKDDGVIFKSGISYQQSLNNWYTYKTKWNNDYAYTVVTYSWTGYHTETKLTIQDGKVTTRDYKAIRQIAPNSPIDTVFKAWTESSANLNTHGQYEGAEVLTLDGVYDKAKNVWLKADINTNAVSFDTDKRGIISSCGFTPKGCQDDCFNGIIIKEIIGL